MKKVCNYFIFVKRIYEPRYWQSLIVTFFLIKRINKFLSKFCAKMKCLNLCEGGGGGWVSIAFISNAFRNLRLETYVCSQWFMTDSDLKQNLAFIDVF